MTDVTLEAQPTIATERLILRPLRVSDAGLIALYVGDVRVAEMTRSIPHPYPPGAAEAFIAKANNPARSEDVWAMEHRASGRDELVGTIGLARKEGGSAEVGYWVAPAFWNVGFASEALQALLEANPQNLTRVEACVFQGNPQSARVLMRAGFEYTGDCEGHSVAQGRTRPTWTYRKTLTA
ncbi:MAG: GNAT family protein [Pseudomonadota bacterium]